MTTPLAMIIVGAMPRRSRLGRWSGLADLAASVVILIAIPVIYCLLFSPVFSNPLVNGVMITMAAMPAAAGTAVFAEQYGADARLASQIVFVSTIGSLITIPLMVAVLL